MTQSGETPRRGRTAPSQVTAKLTIPFVGEVAGLWEPADAERTAAWELYFQLASRVAVVPLERDEGVLREALTSLYSLYDVTRGILHKHGPAVAPPVPPGRLTFGVLAMVTLNRVLRPLLTVWHPRLAAYEALRPEGTDPVSYERAWSEADELRRQLDATRQALRSLARTLQQVAEVGDLIDLPVPRPPLPPPARPPQPPGSSAPRPAGGPSEGTPPPLTRGGTAFFGVRHGCARHQRLCGYRPLTAEGAPLTGAKVKHGSSTFAGFGGSPIR
ncbi:MULTISPECIES: hypothetical protein [unclassified Streptomyces]|uniref:hypothetical protein n=1 Tax=unclassified Streptomyces TaxID=2593676 RepID=UPI00382858F9